MKKKSKHRPKKKTARSALLKNRFPRELQELFTYGEPDFDSDAAEIWASEMGAHVERLADIVLDPDCNESDAPTCWAPLHALNVLTALADPTPAPRLIELFVTFDEWMTSAIVKYFGALGDAALPLLQSFLTDRARLPEQRAYVSDAFVELAEKSPDLRPDIVGFLCDFLNREEADDNEGEEELSSSVINALTKIGDEAALPAIRRAFDEDRVATLQHSYSYVEATIKGEDVPDDGEGDLLIVPIRCRSCQRERRYHYPKYYYDRTYDDPGSPHSPLIVPGQFVCSKCGAIDQYELSSLGSLQVLVQIMRERPEGEQDTGIIPRRFVAFGKPMHPFAAIEQYKAALAKDPKDHVAHLGYANILSFLERYKEAREHYEQVLALDPESYSAMLKMGQVAHREGEETAAVDWYEKAKEVVERVDLPLQDRQEICDALEGEIHFLQEGGEPSEGLKQLLLDASGRVLRGPVDGPRAEQKPFTRTEAKVKPNDRCPCGSGKKYKKCCM